MREKISHANIFIVSDGRVSIEYFDGQERWAEMSGTGLDKIDRLAVNEGESQEDFLIRLKEHIWENYLKPTPERFGRLVG